MNYGGMTKRPIRGFSAGRSVHEHRGVEGSAEVAETVVSSPVLLPAGGSGTRLAGIPAGHPPHVCGAGD